MSIQVMLTVFDKCTVIVKVNFDDVSGAVACTWM